MQLKIDRIETPYEFIAIYPETNAIFRCRTTRRIQFAKMQNFQYLTLENYCWNVTQHKLICRTTKEDIFVNMGANN